MARKVQVQRLDLITTRRVRAERVLILIPKRCANRTESGVRLLLNHDSISLPLQEKVM